MNIPSIIQMIVLNIIAFFTLEIYTSYYAKEYIPERKLLLRKIFIIYNIAYSFVPDFPFCDIINFLQACLTNYLYVHFTTKDTIKKKFKLSIRYLLFTNITGFFIYPIHSFLTMDWIYSMENTLYHYYKEIILYFLIYVGLSVYINLKKYTYEQTERKTIRTFNLLILAISIFISIVPLMLKMETEESQNLLITTFSLLMVLILFVLSLHKKLLNVMDENRKTKIELEINRLKKEYTQKLDANVKELKQLRHDMKNHFIVIDGYARENNTEQIIAYVHHMTGESYSNHTITTPSPVVSSLLNAKAAICTQQGILFSLEQDFVKIYFSDFDILTILGNVLDNAIRAAGACTNGKISLEIKQKASYLVIDCENNYCEELVEENQLLLSTKQEEGHGLGLGNVQQTIEALNGSMHISHESHTFHINLEIPNYV